MTISKPQKHLGWTGAALCLSLLLLGAGLGAYGSRNAESHPTAGPVNSAPALPLVVYRQTEPFSGTITGGVKVTGTLSPSLPGVNLLTLHLRLPDRQAVRGSHASLVLSMPGMAMRPVKAILTATNQGYSGRVILPIFGRYRAQVHAASAQGRYAGDISLTMPLIVGSQ